MSPSLPLTPAMRHSAYLGRIPIPSVGVAIPSVGVAMNKDDFSSMLSSLKTIAQDNIQVLVRQPFSGYTMLTGPVAGTTNKGFGL